MKDNLYIKIFLENIHAFPTLKFGPHAHTQTHNSGGRELKWSMDGEVEQIKSHMMKCSHHGS